MKKVYEVARTLDVTALELPPDAPDDRSTAEAEQTEDALVPLPMAIPPARHPEERTRRHLVGRLCASERMLKDYSRDLREAGGDSDARREAYKALARFNGEIEAINETLRRDFVPQHGPNQMLGADALLVSRLFNVRNKNVPRLPEVRLELRYSEGQSLVYTGPELRQSEGVVFMSLINILRDYPAGLVVSFSPGDLCKALYGHYDGHTRNQLKNSIIRLMRGVLTFPSFSVQLAQKFTHPSKGPWSVAVDACIVRLFQELNYTWLDFKLHRSLTAGVTTWLYAYVRTQPQLRPIRLESLIELSGSDAKSAKAFKSSLYRALDELAVKGVIAPDFVVTADVLHWRKLKP